jgi:lysophospholipase L1-like esterase
MTLMNPFRIPAIAMLAPVLSALNAIHGAEAQPDGSAKQRLEAIEWCDIWQPNQNKSGLPRVLLICDSISRAYYPVVQKNLVGKALVDRLSTSAFVSDPMLLAEVAMVLDNTRYDLVHFNNGMHGWQHSEEEYRAGLPILLETIRKHAPSAKLIWAATTPLKASVPVKPGEPRVSDERIAERNAIALEIFKPLGIAVDDLSTPMLDHPELHSDNIHFNPNGIALQGRQVADEIVKMLARQAGDGIS